MNTNYSHQEINTDTITLLEEEISKLVYKRKNNIPLNNRDNHLIVGVFTLLSSGYTKLFVDSFSDLSIEKNHCEVSKIYSGNTNVTGLPTEIIVKKSQYDFPLPNQSYINKEFENAKKVCTENSINDKCFSSHYTFKNNPSNEQPFPVKGNEVTTPVLFNKIIDLQLAALLRTFSNMKPV